ncbi:hypothetical protein DPMN_029736 [Dreissena polymorpha]|uniref:Uncharacterized protein n=1 Tax=Dreissena polymorpha TaxID=45954 RepID=A0A9D4RGH9_DREPO|nr:hypothetical protein DPMN_029736 [Dreissena polymorpha]
MGLADCLSRLPLSEEGEKAIDEELLVLNIETLSCSNHDELLLLQQKINNSRR